MSYLERAKIAAQRYAENAKRELGRVSSDKREDTGYAVERGYAVNASADSVAGGAATSPVPAPGSPRDIHAAYAFPWPDVLPGLGSRRVVAFTPCLDCVDAGERSSTWIAYGAYPLCLAHAKARNRQ